VYTVAPSINDINRVHTTSAPSAAMPESAMAKYTARVPTTGSGGAAGFIVVYRSRRATRQHPGHARDHDVDRHSHECCRGKIVHAKQIETGEQAPEYSAGDVAAIEETEPRHTRGRRFNPAGDGGKCRTHEHRGNQQAHGAEKAAQQNANEPDDEMDA